MNLSKGWPEFHQIALSALLDADRQAGLCMAALEEMPPEFKGAAMAQYNLCVSFCLVTTMLVRADILSKETFLERATVRYPGEGKVEHIEKLFEVYEMILERWDSEKEAFTYTPPKKD